MSYFYRRILLLLLLGVRSVLAPACHRPRAAVTHDVISHMVPLRDLPDQLHEATSSGGAASVVEEELARPPFPPRPDDAAPSCSFLESSSGILLACMELQLACVYDSRSLAHLAKGAISFVHLWSLAKGAISFAHL